MQKLAVFALVRLSNGLYAATTRPDRPGTIGLPGGKVEEGETLIGALTRECAEEGWQVSHVQSTPIQVRHIDSYLVFWFTAKHATILSTYKEQGRITPICATTEQILASGMGNESLPVTSSGHSSAPSPHTPIIGPM